MKKVFLLVCSCALMAACNNGAKTNKSGEKDSVTTEVADTQGAEMNCEGTYKGTLPAADCPGIETTLTLNANKTFTLHSVYVERNDSSDEKGTYTVSENVLTLQDEGGEQSYYKVEEKQLRQLDKDKKEVTGEMAEHYVLKKD